MANIRKRKAIRTGGPHQSATMRRMRVIDEYFKNGFNQKAAMLSAGYNQKTAEHSSFSVFGREDVQAEIKKRQEQLAKKFELTEDWVIRRLMILADADLGVTLRKLKDSNFDLSVLTPDESYALNELTEDTFMQGRGENALPVLKQKIKLHDKKGALDSLARKLGMFNDKLDIRTEVSIAERLQKGKERMRAKVASKNV